MTYRSECPIPRLGATIWATINRSDRYESHNSAHPRPVTLLP